jgi:hypothetical protein
MAVIMQFSLSVMTPCILVACHQRFGGNCCLRLESDGIRHSAVNNVGYREREYKRTLLFPFFVLHRPLPYILLFCREDGGSRFLQNFGYDLSDYTV